MVTADQERCIIEGPMTGEHDSPKPSKPFHSLLTINRTQNLRSHWKVAISLKVSNMFISTYDLYIHKVVICVLLLVVCMCEKLWVFFCCHRIKQFCVKITLVESLNETIRNTRSWICLGHVASPANVSTVGVISSQKSSIAKGLPCQSLVTTQEFPIENVHCWGMTASVYLSILRNPLRLLPAIDCVLDRIWNLLIGFAPDQLNTLDPLQKARIWAIQCIQTSLLRITC